MSVQRWKMIERKTLLEHPRMVLVEDTVTLPDGKTAHYLRYAPSKIQSVAIIAVNDKQELVLQKEYSYPPDRVMWQLPGGAMLDSEDIPTAANRELSEEFGMIAKSCRTIGSFYVNNRRSDEKQYVVFCTNLTPKDGQKDDIEFIESYWLHVAKVRAMITDDTFDNINLLAALNIWFCLEKVDQAKPEAA